MPSYITPKLELDAFELLFHTHFVCVSSRTFRTGIDLIPFFGSKVYANAFLCIWKLRPCLIWLCSLVDYIANNMDPNQIAQSRFILYFHEKCVS